MVKKTSKEYALITIDENHALKLKNDTLIDRIRSTQIFIEGAEDAVKERDKKMAEKADWEAYLACDPIPKPFAPVEIRKFFAKAQLFEEEDVELTVNWRLAIDERSILNQDIDRKDFTEISMKKSIPNFGQQYDARVTDAMIMRFLAYHKVNQYIDNLTYRILSSEDAYMETLNVTSAEYAYCGTNFDMHLWALKNLPINLDPVSTISKQVSLDKIDVEIIMPFSVLCENMVIRGLHYKFDHFSAHARFYELPQLAGEEKNLRLCLASEWDDQMKLQAEVKDRMLSTREEFEEAQRIKAEEEEAKARKAKSQDKGSAPAPKKDKPKKPPKEPPIVLPNQLPVIRQDFLNNNFLEYEEAMMTIHPDTFGLSRGEVNLRKYQILGGVYKINQLSKPNTVALPQIIISWINADRSLQHEDVQVTFTDTTKSKATAVKFFEISFTLPECYCLWGEPIPCLFEEGETYRAEDTIQPEAEKTLTELSPVIINDFNLHELFTRSLMYNFIENSIPRIISSFKFPADLADDDDDKKGKATLGRVKLTAADQAKEKELAMKKQLLSYENQNCPERLFPFFKKAHPVTILPLPEEDKRVEATHPYEYYSDFYKALLEVEQAYRQSKFKDKKGNFIQVFAEKYEKNIRMPRYSKLILMGTRLSTRGSKSRVSSRGSMQRFPSKIMDRESMRAPSVHSAESTSKEKVTLETPKEIKKEPVAKTKKGGKGKRRSVRRSQPMIVEEEDTDSQYSKWSTSNILKGDFKRNIRKITILTDRLGTFGFAFNRYQHFPFKNWLIRPHEENLEEVELVIETEFAMFRFYITGDGYRVSVTDFTAYINSRKVYFEITKPITDINFLKEKLQQKFLNIFPERDAVWYMDGYFSDKHLAAELHTYNCISLYATSLKFKHSIWNKLSNRRTLVLSFGERRDLDDDLFLLCIRPEDVIFVEITELCSELNEIDLEYARTWRNLEWYPDLNHLIISTYVNWSEMRTKDPNVVYYLKNLLQAIRPLSCS